MQSLDLRKLASCKCVSHLIVIVIVGFLTYSNSLFSPFLFDDYPNIVDNPDIKISDLSFNELDPIFNGSSVNRRPIAYLTFSLNYYFSGLNVLSYHVTNIVIHILTAIFTYIFIWLTYKNIFVDSGRIRGLALLATLLWLVHPVQIQSVTYIVQRMNSLAAMFIMAALSFYVYARLYSRNVSQKRVLFFVVLLCWLLGVGSKETAYILPMLIFIYEVIILKTKIRRIHFLLFLFFCAAGVAVYFRDIFSFWNSLHLDYHFRNFSMSERLMTETRVVIFYLSLIVLPLPSRLNLQHDFSVSHSLVDPITTGAAVILLIFFLLVAFFLRKKLQLVSFAIFWFLVGLLIESTLIPLELVFEHRLYLPSIGICMLTGYLAAVPKQYTRTSCFVAVGLIAVLSLLTVQRNQSWQTKLSLTYDTVMKSPRLARAYGAYAQALFELGLYNESITALNEAVRLEPDNVDAYVMLGLVYEQLNKEQIAILFLIQALQKDPNNKKAYNNLGLLFYKSGDYQKAEDHLKRAVTLDPNYIQAWFNLALVYQRVTKSMQAESCLLKAHNLAPENIRIGEALISLYCEEKQCNKLNNFIEQNRRLSSRIAAELSSCGNCREEEE